MEHRTKGRKLKRTASHRKALLANLAASLIKHKRIKTTVAKAKELRTYLEPFITKAKNSLIKKETDIHNRRIVRKSINDKDAIRILFEEIGSKVGKRAGGYLRIIKTGFRPGDGADEAIIEFVDYTVIKEKEIAAKKKDDKVKDTESTEEKPVEEKEKPKKESKPKAKKKTESKTEKTKKVAKPKKETKSKKTKED